MWKYILAYLICNCHEVECPDYKPTTDKFGVTTWPSTHCLVLHMETTCDTIKKYFSERDSAYAFYNDAKKRWDESLTEIGTVDSSGNLTYKKMHINWGIGEYLDNPTIDSIEIKSTKQ